MTSRFSNPRPQFFDSAGDPLISGKMFFFESGTDTPKNTFADVNETIPNANPVLLTGDGRLPNVFYAGTARAILTDSDDVQIWAINDVGTFGSGAAFDDWNSIVEYEIGAYVVGSDGLVYKSLQNNNTNNDPIASATFWEQVSFLRTWNPNITYALGDGGVVGSNGQIYKSLQAANLNNDPVSSPAFWGTSENPFDQDLNTTDSPTFVVLTAGDIDLNAPNPEILGGDPDGATHLSSSTTKDTGANIILYGEAHATKGLDIELRSNGTVFLHFDNSTGIAALAQILALNQGKKLELGGVAGGEFINSFTAGILDLAARGGAHIYTDTNNNDPSTAVAFELHTGVAAAGGGGGGDLFTILKNGEIFANLPTSAGATGSLWNDSGTVKVAV